MPELERTRSEWSSRHRAGWRGSERPSLTRENPTAPASSGTAPSQPPALAPQGAPRPTVAWSGPSRPLLQFPGLAPIVGVLPACQAPGPGPRRVGRWEAGTLPPGSLSRQAPGCRGGEGGTKASFSPCAAGGIAGALAEAPGAWEGAGPGGAAESRAPVSRRVLEEETGGAASPLSVARLAMAIRGPAALSAALSLH